MVDNLNFLGIAEARMDWGRKGARESNLDVIPRNHGTVTSV